MMRRCTTGPGRRCRGELLHVTASVGTPAYPDDGTMPDVATRPSKARSQMSTLSALPDRQSAASFGMFPPIMQELLQQIDSDYYRSVRLRVVRAELEQLRQERSASADTERRESTRTDSESGDVGITTRRASLNESTSLLRDVLGI